jgi:beta-1,4-mannosyl-glycoprotein beta-1,4-N-acetylglucosaminyltransferase
MKIFDAFTFFNELDLLEIRLEELYDHVDFFILCESTKTHQNKDKPLFFLENKNRYKKFLPKIIHKVFEPKSYPYPWYIENEQRNELKNAEFEMSNDDIFLLSDADEIVNTDCIKYIRSNPEKFSNPATCIMQMSYLYINTLIQEPFDHKNWRGTMILSKNSFDRKSLNEYRVTKENFTYLWNSGWHFSFLGGVDKIKTKIESYAHAEFNNNFYTSPDAIETRIKNLQDPLGRSGFKLYIENDLSKFPDSSLKFKNLFLEKDENNTF